MFMFLLCSKYNPALRFFFIENEKKNAFSTSRLYKSQRSHITP